MPEVMSIILKAHINSHLALQGGAGSGFLGALSIPEKCGIWLLAVGAWLPACQALSLFLPRWAGCLVNRKRHLVANSSGLALPKR